MLLLNWAPVANSGIPVALSPTSSPVSLAAAAQFKCQPPDEGRIKLNLDASSCDHCKKTTWELISMMKTGFFLQAQLVHHLAKITVSLWKEQVYWFDFFSKGGIFAAGSRI